MQQNVDLRSKEGSAEPHTKELTRAQASALRKISAALSKRDRRPFPFQKLAWSRYLGGEHGFITAPTGSGKTMAAFVGALIEWSISHPNEVNPTPVDGAVAEKPSSRRRESHGLQVLWLTPLRALAADLQTTLQAMVDNLGIPWRVETRTGDTRASQKTRQRKTLPEVLITTPESLTLMLTWPDWVDKLRGVQLIVADEWHALQGTKRGVQTELALARLRNASLHARVWGLSATISNPLNALRVLTGEVHLTDAAVIDPQIQRRTQIHTTMPAVIERFPWAGHLGLTLLPAVAATIAENQTTLVFTNTRSQTELWYQALLAHQPQLAGQMAVHHGSIDQTLRQWIEDQLREGKLKCCVCTSSLDLGVDFPLVDHVIQIGSPKGAARLLQRCGRSRHQPGRTSEATFVPTNGLELAEIAAVREVIKTGKLETAESLSKPLDVLVQHLVTVAIGGGFQPQELLREVRSTVAYRDLSDEEWQWALNFVKHGGNSLGAYADFHRVEEHEGRFVVTDRQKIRQHRISIGTIVSDASVQVKYLKGKKIGSVEETFIGRLKPGDKFSLGGKLLELVRIHENTAYVKRTRGKATAVPRWLGGRLPISSEISSELRRLIGEAKRHQVLQADMKEAEMQAMEPLLELQRRWSELPDEHELLIERFENRDGHYLFIYPFEGRRVHEGLAALLAYRLSRLEPITFSMAVNDYGLTLVSPEPAPLEKMSWQALFSGKNLETDILSSLNASEMCRRQFREIARIAGLVSGGMPYAKKSDRQLQASSNLFYEVFRQYDPTNLLLLQAEREVLQHHLEQTRLETTLQRLSIARILDIPLPRPSPLAFSLLVEQMRDRVSSETLQARVQKMIDKLEREAEAC